MILWFTLSCIGWIGPYFCPSWNGHVFVVLTFQTTGIAAGQSADLFFLVADSQGSLLPIVKAWKPAIMNNAMFSYVLVIVKKVPHLIYKIIICLRYELVELIPFETSLHFMPPSGPPVICLCAVVRKIAT